MFRAILLSTPVALVATLPGCGPNPPGRGTAATARDPHQEGHSSTPRHPTSGPHPARPTAHADAVGADDDDEPQASRSQLSSTRHVARAVLTTYLAHLYGQLPARDVTSVDQGLRWQLEHGHAITTPAERASPPHIARLSLSSSGPPISVTAVAVVTTADSQASQVTATLEPHHSTWLVVTVSQ
jgi:hypothetical protein